MTVIEAITFKLATSATAALQAVLTSNRYQLSHDQSVVIARAVQARVTDLVTHAFKTDPDVQADAIQRQAVEVAIAVAAEELGLDLVRLPSPTETIH